jgi:hypothetical protein
MLSKTRRKNGTLDRLNGDSSWKDTSKAEEGQNRLPAVRPAPAAEPTSSATGAGTALPPVDSGNPASA